MDEALPGEYGLKPQSSQMSMIRSGGGGHQQTIYRRVRLHTKVRRFGMILIGAPLSVFENCA